MKILKLLLAGCLVTISSQSYAALELIEDFSSSVVDCSNFPYGRSSEFSIYYQSDRVHFTLDPYMSIGGVEETYCAARIWADRNTMGLNENNAPVKIATSVKLSEVNFDPSMEYTAFSMSGYFYNTRTDEQRAVFGSAPGAEGDGPTGDVWVSLRFGDRGAGLEVWWIIDEVLDNDYVSFKSHSEETLIAPGALHINEDYQISIDYDGANKFTFSINGSSKVVMGPARGGDKPAYQGSPRIGVRADAHSPLMPAALGTETISASIGPIYVNDQLYDDYKGSSLVHGLNTKLWTRGERSSSLSATNTLDINLDSNRAETTVFSEQGRNSASGNLHLLSHYTKYRAATKVQVKAKINNVDLGTRGQAGITGIWYNDGRPNGSYDGYSGDIFTLLRIERRDSGTYRAYAYGSRIKDKGWNEEEQVLFHSFDTINVQPGNIYDLSVERQGNQLIFKVDTEQYIHDIPVNNYPPSPGNGYRSVQGKIARNYTGNTMVELDDIYAEPSVVGIEDSVSVAQALLGDIGGFSLTTRGATAEPEEPFHGDIGDSGTPMHSVWFQWDAPADGQYSFDTNGSSFDTLLSVYSVASPSPAFKQANVAAALATDFSAYSKEAGNDNANDQGALYSEVTFSATMGETYYIAIDGAAGATGEVILNYRTLEEKDDDFLLLILPAIINGAKK